MKKQIIVSALAATLLIALPAFAADPHSHSSQDQELAIEQETMSGLDNATNELQSMRMKIEKETDSNKRMGMMKEHKQMMQEKMKAMSMHMNSNEASTPDSAKSAPKSMGDRMSMMEHKMQMMEKMMSGKGGMMSGMMSNSTSDQNAKKIEMMEKQMSMMQEIMSGIMLQQDMQNK